MASNISYEEFAENFITQIRAVEKTGDGDDCCDYTIGFNVVCKPNNRVMYFESCVESNVLPSLSNLICHDEVACVGWSNVLPQIKTWAAQALTASNLLGSVFIPDSNLTFTTASNIDLPTYTSNFTTKVSRFEVYPPQQPKSWCVGFSVYRNTSNFDYMYTDTNVIVDSFSTIRAEDEILNKGWSNTKENIGIWAAKKMAESPLINSVFINSNIW